MSIHGGEIGTTNNRMELLAAIRTLQWIIKNRSIDRSIDRKDPSANKELYKIHTDSNYVKEGITKWIIGWKKKNFVGVKNPDLWQLLDKLNVHMGKCVEWHWVRGHDISEGNIEADRLANLGCTVAK
jgi:ribonuclease HI